jgi:hypothetical protein
MTTKFISTDCIRHNDIDKKKIRYAQKYTLDKPIPLVIKKKHEICLKNHYGLNCVPSQIHILNIEVLTLNNSEWHLV